MPNLQCRFSQLLIASRCLMRCVSCSCQLMKIEITGIFRILIRGDQGVDQDQVHYFEMNEANEALDYSASLERFCNSLIAQYKLAPKFCVRYIRAEPQFILATIYISSMSINSVQWCDIPVTRYSKRDVGFLEAYKLD